MRKEEQIVNTKSEFKNDNIKNAFKRERPINKTLNK